MCPETALYMYISKISVSLSLKTMDLFYVMFESRFVGACLASTRLYILAFYFLAETQI